MHGESGWLLELGDDARLLARAIARVYDDASLAARLGAGAQRVLLKSHDWPALAWGTLDLAREAIARRV